MHGDNHSYRTAIGHLHGSKHKAEMSMDSSILVSQSVKEKWAHSHNMIRWAGTVLQQRARMSWSNKTRLCRASAAHGTGA